jgi:hypothetical protein
MRTWSVNVDEFLLIACETQHYPLLRFAKRSDVGCVAIALTEGDAFTLAKQTCKQPLEPKDFGLIDFISRRGHAVPLVPPEGAKVHEDGVSGEVFLRTYTERGPKKEEKEFPGNCLAISSSFAIASFVNAIAIAIAIFYYTNRHCCCF